jgi:hypothetical protein
MGKTVAVAAAMVVVFGLAACGNPPPVPVSVAGEPGATAPPVAAPSVSAAPSASAPSASAPSASVAPPVGAEVTTVRLSTGASSTTIRTADGTGYQLERVVHHTDPAYAGPEPGPSHRLDGTTLVVDGCDQPDCWFSYTVTVPRWVSVGGSAGSGATHATGVGEVDVRSGSGEVEVADAAGPVRVSSGSASVHLTAVGGDLEVHTGSGSVEGSDLRSSRTTVDTGSGSIDLSFASEQSVDASTGSGRIHLAVPAGRYRLDLATVRGAEVGTGVVDDPGASSLIRATSRKGSISVTAAPR